MTYHFLTLFPNIISAYFEESMMKRAVDAGLIAVDVRDIRDYTKDRHRRTDDYPYGGGAGLVKPLLVLGMVAMTQVESFDIKPRPD